MNALDYSREQLDVWATRNTDINKWNKSFLENTTIIAETNNLIVGFGDIESNGYLDRLYVHRNFQRQGIATMIVDRLEEQVSVPTITTYSSITAKPFFTQRGYDVVRENSVIIDGIELTNFIMKKNI